MKQVLLHIGRHKTGTSALQRFLFRNRRHLERQGFCYPASGLVDLGHHQIARLLTPGADGISAQARATLDGVMQALQVEAGAGAGTLLLSSEAFQNCAPPEVARVFEPDRTTIIVYLREQAQYIVSAYQQRVQARGHRGSVEAYALNFGIDYNRFMQAWEQCFGHDRVRLRLYGRTLLEDGDIISDFCSTVGIARGGHLIRPAGDRNPSIGGALLEFKRLVNTFDSTAATSREVYAALSALAAENPAWRRRPIIPPRALDGLSKDWSESNRLLFERYPVFGDGFDAKQQARPAGPKVDRREVIEVAEVFAARFPAASEALRALAASSRAPVAPRPWSELLEPIQLAPNLYEEPDGADAASSPPGVATSAAAGASPQRWRAPEMQPGELDALFVNTVFEGIFQRPPREKELNHWLKSLATELDPRQLPAQLLATNEFVRLQERARGSTEANKAFVQTLIKTLLLREPKEGEEAHWVATLDKGLDPRQLPARLAASKEFERLQQQRRSLYVPPGHPYSPIVDVDLIRDQYAKPAADQLPAGIALDRDAMRRTWGQLLPYLDDNPLPQTPEPAWRYHLRNPQFGYGDGSILQAMLRLHRPRRIVQVGLGQSVACAFDTITHCLRGTVEIDLVDPRPALAQELLGAEAAGRFTLHPNIVQQTDSQVFTQLESGDFLFVNSTHVLKTGSDVAHVLFEILPALQPGVFVRLQSIFWPFEYRPKWIVEDNRSWNELYALRAFLMYNGAFEIVFFNDYFVRHERALIEAGHPALLANPGTGLWLRKKLN